MTHLDLCSGIGGFAIAAQRAGFETVGFSEIEPYCEAILFQHWPDVPNYGDLRTADFSHLRGHITVLSAGVPCQPASLAGKRRGASDDRWLWPAVLDVVGAVLPAWCLFENPYGIESLYVFRDTLTRLEEMGYMARLFSVQANSVGARHRRERLFFVANRARELFDGSGNARPGRRLEFANGGQTLADADGARLEEHQSREPEQLATLIGSSGQDWERIVRSAFGLTQPPLCRRVDGVPNRSHCLKALGNAVVPQQAYPFFAAIAGVERLAFSIRMFHVEHVG